MAEFAPFRYWSPIHDSLEESYPETEEGIAAMEFFAKEAGDTAYANWIRLYRRCPKLWKVLANQLLNPKREALYQLIYEKVKKASFGYPEREYEAEIQKQIEEKRKAAVDELKARGFFGTYPEFEKGCQKILVTEEHPFTILEWNHYKFKIQFMV